MRSVTHFIILASAGRHDEGEGEGEGRGSGIPHEARKEDPCGTNLGIWLKLFVTQKDSNSTKNILLLLFSTLNTLLARKFERKNFGRFISVD